jgi:hypothetical protein
MVSDFLKRRYSSKLSKGERLLTYVYDVDLDDWTHKYCEWYVNKFGETREPWYMKPIDFFVFEIQEIKVALAYRKAVKGRSRYE